MADDKLRELTPIAIDFVPGERPTDEKLEGMMTQVSEGMDFLEGTLGDLFGDAGFNTLYTTNIGRDLGTRHALNLLMQPDVQITNYVQTLTAGKVEHELDLIPVGSGSTILVASTDTSIFVNPANYKLSESELEVPGDWTIRPGKLEDGIEKNSRKLITHQPSSGGTITFALVTSGRGSAYQGARFNTIPTVAQAEAGGPFLDVVLSDVSNNIYTITLPAHNTQYNELGESADASLSNTVPALGQGQQYELASYFFDATGLDMAADDLLGDPKYFPLNTIKIYDWDAKKEIEGVDYIQASFNAAARKYQFTVKYRPDVLLDTGAGRYMIVQSGTSVYEMLGALQKEVFNHKHDGDDMVRAISHKALMDLRKGDTDTGNRSAWYGTSNIENNDHSNYLHRDGFTDSDTGAGGNIMRGHVVVGSTVTGDAAEHENHNLDADSHSVSFGHIDEGGSIYFDKVRDHNLTEGRGNIPQNFADTALVIEGSVDDTTGLRKTAYIDGNLRVGKDVALGTTADDDVFISGDLYVHQNVTLTPKSSAEISALVGERGKAVYSDDDSAILVHNGVAWVNSSIVGLAATVGDGINSHGKYNGTNAATIQNAINYASTNGGGIVLIQRGTYALAGTTVTIPSNVCVKGAGGNTLVTQLGANTAFEFVVGSSHSCLSDLRVANAELGTSVNGMYHEISNVVYEGCSYGVRLQSTTAHLSIDRSTRFVSCAKDIDNLTTNANNYFGGDNTIGYHNGFYFVDPADKQGSLYKFTRTSGAGSLVFEDTTDSAMGRGRFAITGTGTWLVDEFLAVQSGLGIGGQASYKGSAAGGQFSFGAWCYDSAFTSLGHNGGYIANNVAATTNWQLAYNFQKDEGVALANLRVGTKFVKPFIQVTSNPGTIYLDGFNIIPMNYSSIGLYL